MVKRFCISGQKIQASLCWTTAIDWTDRIKYSVDRVKISLDRHPTGSKHNSDQHRLNPTKKIETCPTDGYTRSGRLGTRNWGTSPPLVGRPGSSGELEAEQTICDFHSTTPSSGGTGPGIVLNATLDMPRLRRT